jgi:hypothetical protein
VYYYSLDCAVSGVGLHWVRRLGFGVFMGLLFSGAAALGANQPPVVSMTSPANGASFISPGTVVLKATATSSGSTIASVTYMDGPSKIAAVSAGPAYTYNWKTVLTTRS